MLWTNVSNKLKTACSRTKPKQYGNKVLLPFLYRFLDVCAQQVCFASISAEAHLNSDRAWILMRSRSRVSVGSSWFLRKMIFRFWAISCGQIWFCKQNNSLGSMLLRKIKPQLLDEMLKVIVGQDWKDAWSTSLMDFALHMLRKLNRV